MLSDLAYGTQVYLVTGYTDLRRSIDGLATIVQGQLELDPFCKGLFLFCGRRCDRIKGLLWEAVSKDFSGKETDFCFSTSDWITADSSGLETKQKQNC